MPQILLVDVDEETQRRLEEDGFNIDIGTFGSKYRVIDSKECGFNHKLPFLTEKDIIVVDMNKENQRPSINPLICQWVGSDKNTFVAGEGSLHFNPRNLSAFNHSAEILRNLNRGGIVIVFTDKVEEETYYPVEVSNGLRKRIKPMKVSNFDWLPNRHLNPENCIDGKEIFYRKALMKV